MALALRQLNPIYKKGDIKFFFLCLIARYVFLLTKGFVIVKKHTQEAANNAVF